MIVPDKIIPQYVVGRVYRLDFTRYQPEMRMLWKISKSVYSTAVMKLVI